jgi:hypothetical protein
MWIGLWKGLIVAVWKNKWEGLVRMLRCMRIKRGVVARVEKMSGSGGKKIPEWKRG